MGKAERFYNLKLPFQHRNVATPDSQTAKTPI
jgi:hypothetical protein